MIITQWFMTFKEDIFLFNSSLPRAKSETGSHFLCGSYIDCGISLGTPASRSCLILTSLQSYLYTLVVIELQTLDYLGLSEIFSQVGGLFFIPMKHHFLFSFTNCSLFAINHYRLVRHFPVKYLKLYKLASVTRYSCLVVLIIFFFMVSLIMCDSYLLPCILPIDDKAFKYRKCFCFCFFNSFLCLQDLRQCLAHNNLVNE